MTKENFSKKDRAFISCFAHNAHPRGAVNEMSVQPIDFSESDSLLGNVVISSLQTKKRNQRGLSRVSLSEKNFAFKDTTVQRWKIKECSLVAIEHFVFSPSASVRFGAAASRLTHEQVATSQRHAYTSPEQYIYVYIHICIRNNFSRSACRPFLFFFYFFF